MTGLAGRDEGFRPRLRIILTQHGPGNERSEETPKVIDSRYAPNRRKGQREATRTYGRIDDDMDISPFTLQRNVVALSSIGWRIW